MASRLLALAVGAVAVAVATAACATTVPVAVSTATPAQSAATLAQGQRPIDLGQARRYRLAPLSKAVTRRAPVAGMRCSKDRLPFYGIHLELYARRLALPVPSGIGIAPPQRHSGVYVLGGACLYPIRTFEPTGVTVVDAGRAVTLGQLFAIWGQRLSRGALAGFRGPVVAFVDGRRWHGAPGSIPLRRHAQIVVEVGGLVAPRATYRFPPGL